jgi:hypothetical protein
MIGTRYAITVVRFLVDYSNKEDVEQVHALQDAIKLSQEPRHVRNSPLG